MPTALRLLLPTLIVAAACGDRRTQPARRDGGLALRDEVHRRSAAPPAAAPPAAAPPAAAPPAAAPPAAVPLPSADDAHILDCVGDWHAGAQVLKFWGNHPDYPADAADAYRTDREELVELRYQATNGRLRLWRGEAALADVAFTLSRDETDAHAYRYELRLGAPVFGHDRYEGIVATSFHCAPRPPPR